MQEIGLQRAVARQLQRSGDHYLRRPWLIMQYVLSIEKDNMLSACDCVLLHQYEREKKKD